MEKVPYPRGELLVQPTFDPDLVPIYALTEQKYQIIINNLANLMIAVIEHVQYEGNAQLAWLVADQAHEILREYDEDVAEYVHMSVQQQAKETEQKSD